MQIAKDEQVDSPELNTTSTPRSAMTFSRWQKRLLIPVVVVGFLVLMGVLAYALPVTNPIKRVVVSFLPFPAVVVNGNVVTMGDYVNEYDALTQYLTSTGYEEIPSEQEMRTTLLEALVNKEVIAALARRHGVKLDQARADQFYQEVIEAEGGEEVFLEELDASFGWGKEEFKQRIIKSIVLALQMTEFVSQHEELQASAKQRIEQEMTTPGTIDETSLGQFGVHELPPQWGQVIELEPGQRTSILESDQEFVILRLVGKEETDEGLRVELAAAVSEKKTLENLVSDYIEHSRVWYVIR